jgi:hypothetical protein
LEIITKSKITDAINMPEGIRTQQAVAEQLKTSGRKLLRTT